MKHTTLLALGALLATTATALGWNDPPGAAAGGSYAIDWFTIDGGGGTSTGGSLELSGTIGQHDAGGPMTGGAFSLTGGFWAAETAGAPTCPADLDGSGDVGFSDLLAVLNAWGACPGCPEDIDGDGNVGFSDLLAVLNAWGPCP